MIKSKCSLNLDWSYGLPLCRF